MNTAIAIVEMNLVRLRRASDGEPHLAAADDLLLDEILRDVEHRDGDHHVADRLEQPGAGLGPGAAQRRAGSGRAL